MTETHPSPSVSTYLITPFPSLPLHAFCVSIICFIPSNLASAVSWIIPLLAVCVWKIESCVYVCVWFWVLFNQMCLMVSRSPLFDVFCVQLCVWLAVVVSVWIVGRCWKCCCSCESGCFLISWLLGQSHLSYMKSVADVAKRPDGLIFYLWGLMI